MTQTDAGGSAIVGPQRTEDLVNPERREALVRLAKYTAPAMLALLVSVEDAAAGVCVSGCGFSDILLKRDIAPVGWLAGGSGLYRYRYLWSDAIHVGVMAHEVAATRPEAVHRGTDGYLRVDYAGLGLRMQTWDEWVAAQ